MTIPEVGSRLTTPQIEALPLFSTLIWNSAEYVNLLTGLVAKTGYAIYAPHQLVSHGVTLREVGSVERPVETLEQLKQRLATTARGRAYRSSVSQHNVTEAFDDMNVVTPGQQPLRLGMWCHLHDQEQKQALPVGTVLREGLVDDDDLHGVWIIDAQHEARAALGQFQQNPYDMIAQVAAFPEGTEVHEWREPREDEALRVAAWKRLVWERGARFKSSAGWCGDYEQALSRCGIDEQTVDQIMRAGVRLAANPVPEGMPAVDERISQEQIEHAPVGTVIRHNHRWERTGDDEWTREDGRDIRNNDSFAGWPLIVVSYPQAHAPGDMLTPEQVATLPVGSLVRHEHDGTLTRPISWTMYRRVEGGDRPGGTEAVVSTRREGGCWRIDRVVLVRLGTDGDLARWLIHDHRTLDVLPVGSVMADAHNTWTKQSTGLWLHDQGGQHATASQSRHFGFGNLLVRSINDPGQPETPALGSILNAEQVAALPEGSLLRYDFDGPGNQPRRWTLFIRDDADSGARENQSHTRALASSHDRDLSAHWSSSDNRLIRVGHDGPMHDWLLNQVSAEALPVGSVMIEGGATWAKRDNGEWAYGSRTTTAASSAFMYGSLRVQSIPTAPVLPEGLTVGGRVTTHDQIEAAPAGSLFRQQGGDLEWIIDEHGGLRSTTRGGGNSWRDCRGISLAPQTITLHRWGNDGALADETPSRHGLTPVPRVEDHSSYAHVGPDIF